MDDSTVYWLGIDVAKKTFDAALVSPGAHYPQTPLRDVPVQTFARDACGVTHCLDWVHQQIPDGATVRAVMEATGVYSVELTTLLMACSPQLAPSIVNPERTASFIASLGLRNKTDRLDARALAFYGIERAPTPYEPLTPEHRQLRELSRYRDALVGEKVAEGNRAEQAPQTKVIRRMQTRRDQQRQRDIAALEAEMKRVIDSVPALKKDYELLISIPGVGFITAAVVLAEVGDLRRFERARQATAFVGVSPRETTSGTSVHGGTHVCKKGSARVRQALYLAAMAAVRPQTYLRTTYQELRAHGKVPMVALGAIMRKLITVMRAILISGKPFEAGGKPRGKQPA